MSIDHNPPPRPAGFLARYGAETAAALLVFAAALGWLASRLSPDIAFGIWQGAFLDPTPVQYMPLVSQAVSEGVLRIPTGNPAWRLNVVSLVFAALACAALAAATTRAARAIAGGVEAVAAGMAAAAVFATSHALTYAGTGTTPAALTTFLGLLSVAGLALWTGNDRPFWAVALASAAAGAATVNHPSFALLFLVVIGAYITVPRPGRTWPGLLALFAVFAAAAFVPLLVALARGESLRQFLSHALLTPYPNLADGWPELGYARRLAEDLSPLALVLALPALFGLFRPGLRPYLVLAGLVLLMTGPFLPFLTNQELGRGVPTDFDAPRLMAVAATCLFTGLGVLVAVRGISTARRSRPHRLALLLGLVSIVLTLQANRAPSRNHDLARQVAGEILAGCPEGALLVSGDPGLASIVTAYQHALGLRTDVDVVPADFLTRPRLRGRVEARLDGRARIPSEFPADSDISRWANEHPAILERLMDSPEELVESPHTLDLALWDLVLDNPERWPVCFVGVPSPWLAARAQLSGAVFCYPRRPDPPETGLLDLVERVANGHDAPHDPGIGLAFNEILLPTSELLRRQHGGDDARRVAELAELVGSEDARIWLALSRAAARQGNRDAAARYATEYFADTATEPADREAVQKSLEDELRSGALRNEFGRIVELSRQGKQTTGLRDEVTRQLWMEDDVFTLAEGYSVLSDQNPADLDALYQCAAALTQVGNLDEAQRRLAKAALASPAVISQRLQGDAGRFSLLRVYHTRRPPDDTPPITPSLDGI